MNDPVAVALDVAQVLDACGRYLVGGSLASSLSGEPRSTLDVDIVVAMTGSDVDRLVEALRAEFDVDDRAVARAVRQRSSVNMFHHRLMIKNADAGASTTSRASRSLNGDRTNGTPCTTRTASRGSRGGKTLAACHPFPSPCIPRG